RQRVEAAAARLESVSPLNVLARGYSLTRKESEKDVLRTTERVRPGDILVTQLHQGRIVSRVEEAEYEPGRGREGERNAGCPELRAMGLLRAAEAGVYYRAAWHRFDDANLLLEAGRTTGAVYLAGYTVECMLKALVLASAAPRLRAALRKEFHGQRAHN